MVSFRKFYLPKISRYTVSRKRNCFPAASSSGGPRKKAYNKSSLLYYPIMFRYLEPVFTKNSPVVTSPYNTTLYPPAVPIHNSDNDYFIQGSIMLGEPIQIIASVFDYFNNITEPVAFSITCKTCDDKYILSTYQISVHNQSMYELKIVPILSALSPFSTYQCIFVNRTFTMSWWIFI